MAVDAGHQRTKVDSDGLVANFYQPASETRLPTVIVLGGSDGGIESASWFGNPLAQRGYAVLPLAYFGMETLPPHLVEVPLAYFKKAIDWLWTQHGAALPYVPFHFAPQSMAAGPRASSVGRTHRSRRYGGGKPARPR